MIDTDYEEDIGGEIPSKLWDMVEANHAEIRKIVIQVKLKGRWKTLPKQLKYSKDGPSGSVGDVCRSICEKTTGDHDKRGMDAAYRAQLYVYDAESGDVKRKTVPLRTRENEDGEIETVDDGDFSEKQHIHLLTGIIDKHTEEKDAIMGRFLEMMDKQVALADAVGNQSQKSAEGTAQLAKAVATSATGMAEGYAMIGKMATEHNEKAIPVQLAELDLKAKEGKVDPAAEAFDMLKMMGPLLFGKLMGMDPGKISQLMSVMSASSGSGGTVSQKPNSPTKKPSLPAPKSEEPKVVSKKGSKKRAKKEDDEKKEDAKKDPDDVTILDENTPPEEEQEKAKFLKEWLGTFNEEQLEGLGEALGPSVLERFQEAAEKDDAWVRKMMIDYKEELGKTFDSQEAINEYLAELGNHLTPQQIMGFFSLLPNDDD